MSGLVLYLERGWARSRKVECCEWNPLLSEVDHSPPCVKFIDLLSGWSNCVTSGEILLRSCWDVCPLQHFTPLSSGMIFNRTLISPSPVLFMKPTKDSILLS